MRAYPVWLWVPSLYAMALRSGPITITGRRLEDGVAPTRIGSMSSESFGSSTNFAQAGCWEVTYDFAGDQLRFTLRLSTPRYGVNVDGVRRPSEFAKSLRTNGDGSAQRNAPKRE